MPPPIHAAATLGLSYRPMDAGDMAFIEALYISTRLDELAQTGWPEAQIRQFLTQQHDAQHRHYQQYYPQAEWLIVERGDASIGRLYVEEWPSQLCIVDISLIPDARGHGIGGAILRDVIDWAGASGKPVSIHVEKNNPARRLYDRLGFGLIEDKGVYDLMMTPGPVAASPDAQ